MKMPAVQATSDKRMSTVPCTGTILPHEGVQTTSENDMLSVLWTVVRGRWPRIAPYERKDLDPRLRMNEFLGASTGTPFAWLCAQQFRWLRHYPVTRALRRAAARHSAARAKPRMKV